MASEASERVACVSMATHVAVAHAATIVIVVVAIAVVVRRSTIDALQFWKRIMSTHIWNFNLICGSVRFALLWLRPP